MQLEDYFEFDKFDGRDVIRLKGTRILIEILLDRYLRGASPAQIFQSHHDILSLEQVYAAITYYLHNREKMDEYLKEGQRLADERHQEYLKKGPSPVAQRLIALRAAQPAGAETR